MLKRRAFHGEENEEYEKTRATKARGCRFGENTDSFTCRYFISNLRTLQMQCLHVLMNPFSIHPEQMVWVGQTLRRTVEDSPDFWCALRESYLRNVGPVKVALKTTCFDKGYGPIKVVVKTTAGDDSKQITLTDRSVHSLMQANAGEKPAFTNLPIFL